MWDHCSLWYWPADLCTGPGLPDNRDVDDTHHGMTGRNDLSPASNNIFFFVDEQTSFGNGQQPPSLGTEHKGILCFLADAVVNGPYSVHHTKTTVYYACETTCEWSKGQRHFFHWRNCINFNPGLKSTCWTGKDWGIIKVGTWFPPERVEINTHTVNLMCVAEETSRQLGEAFSTNVWCRTSLDVHMHFWMRTCGSSCKTYSNNDIREFIWNDPSHMLSLALLASFRQQWQEGGCLLEYCWSEKRMPRLWFFLMHCVQPLHECWQQGQQQSIAHSGQGDKVSKHERMNETVITLLTFGCCFSKVLFKKQNRKQNTNKES